MLRHIKIIYLFSDYIHVKMGLQQALSPSSVPLSLYIVVQKFSAKPVGDSFNTSASKMLGIIHFLCGVAAFFSGCFLLGNLNESSKLCVDEAGAGIWCGLIFLLGGILNIIAAKYKSERLIISNLVFNIVTTLFAVVLVTVASMAITDIHNLFPYSTILEQNEYIQSMGFNIVLLIIGLAEIVLGTVSSSLSCKATCCRELENTNQGHVISFANHMQERENIDVEEGHSQPPRYVVRSASYPPY